MFESDNEECWVILGKNHKRLWHGRLVNKTEGEPVRVNFDAAYVMRREETHGDVIGFLHTHPHMLASPSSVDYNTMEAWTLCFGKKLLCGIHGIDGLRFHVFHNDKFEEIDRFIKVGSRLVGSWHRKKKRLWKLAYAGYDGRNERYHDSVIIEAFNAEEAEDFWWDRMWTMYQERYDEVTTVPYDGNRTDADYSVE